MAKCDFTDCENTEMLPFKCKYCSKSFCSVHRLPENHNCEYLHLGKSPLVETKKTTFIAEKEKPMTRKEKRKVKREKQDEAVYEAEYFKPDYHYYSIDESGQVFTTKPSQRKYQDRLVFSLLGDYFSVGREIFDFLIGLLIVIISFSFTSIWMTRLPWSYFGFIVAVIMLIYTTLIYPQKLVAKKFGYQSRYVLSKIGMILTLLTSISPFKILNPGMLLIPDVAFMGKKEKGLTYSTGIILNLLYGSAFILLGWLLTNQTIALFFTNGAFLVSQLLIFSLIPIRMSAGRQILRWHWSIYTILALITIALFVGSILLGVLSF